MKDINKLAIGDSVVVPGRGGWMIKLIKTAKGFDLIHFNPIKEDENQLKFFRYTTEGDPYGAGIVDQEPTLGIPCNTCGVDLPGLIVGALVLNDERNEILERYSWTNLVQNQNKSFRITFEGELKVDGVSKGYLQALFLADVKRMRGYVGLFSPEKPDKVQVFDMENILLHTLSLEQK